MKHDHGHSDIEAFLSQILERTNNFEILSNVFKLLDDSSRLKIFWLLCHCEECVLNISSMLKMSSPAVSHHLKMLKQSGLIVSRREGKEVYYKVNDTTICDFLHKGIEKIMEISCPPVSENK